MAKTERRIEPKDFKVYFDFSELSQLPKLPTNLGSSTADIRAIADIHAMRPSNLTSLRSILILLNPKQQYVLVQYLYM